LKAIERIVVAPDSFKGSLSAMQVAERMALGLARVLPCRIDRFAMADGGEGTIEAVLATRPATRHRDYVANAVGGQSSAIFATLEGPDHLSALLEVAQVVALPNAPGTVEQRSSFGVGQQIKRALDLGAREILVGLGGSSTNDAGVGLLGALGARFKTAAREVIEPRLRQVKLVALSDIDNPLCGEHGATQVYGPQKGVAETQVRLFDGWIAHFAARAESALRRHCTETPGAGAAGGIGWALQLIGATAKSGALAVAEITGLDAALAESDWVLTGEGRSDAQTLRGKVPVAVSQLAHRHGVPVTLLSGGIAEGSAAALTRYFDGCFSIVSRPMDLATAIDRAADLLSDAAEQLSRLRSAKPR
jgi:glycerate kinase